MRTLYVTKTYNHKLSKMWHLPCNFIGELYIQCTINGDINFNKNSIYNLNELLLRGSTKVIEKHIAY